MATSSVNAVVSVLRGHKLLEPAQLDELARSLQPRCPTTQALAKELLQRGWLTPYQANHLLQGKTDALVLGPYVLLERLGEGAMGEIFKARHTSMNRLAAVKILRKDLLTDSDAVGRFFREVEVLSHVSHANIVRAYDADVLGKTHYLAMEYVEGTDLDQLVRERGPLSIPQACDYIRQAANGLQHAHEKGLVHRDIKPSNLLVSQPKAQSKPTSSTEFDLSACGSEFGLVKILDLGLARLQQPAEGSRTRNLTLLAGNQVMQGTPDYMAPEQALDFHSADIRADIYSLGCTLYFLLAGKPPFEGTLHEKLLKHQTAEPAHITSVRGDVPAGLLPIMRKMLAKRPPDRYQTPGELARDLTAFLLSGGGGSGSSSTPPPNKNLDKSSIKKHGSTLRIQQEKEAGAGGRLGAVSTKPVIQINKRPTQVLTPEEKRRRRKLILIGSGVVTAILGGFVILVLVAGGRSEPSDTGSLSRASQTVASVQAVTRASTFTTEAPRVLQPTLIIQCGKANGKQQDQKKAAGYDYKLVQGKNHDGWDVGAGAVKSHCWHDEKELIFEITIPKGTGGLLHLMFCDGDKLGRKQTLFVQGKQFGGVYENFGVAENVDVPVPASEADQGKITVKLVNQAGKYNAVVSVIEFSPYAARR
jgi:serine/threonine protein kinase